RDWERLGGFVDEDVVHNGRPLGLAGYRAMLERDCGQVPDLRYRVELLLANPPWIAARLCFDVRPNDGFLGLSFDGRRVTFHENVFYRMRAGRICEVRSIVDRQAIEAQL